MEEYFGCATSRMIVMQPIELTNTLEKFDYDCNVNGCGNPAQAGVIRLGIARALKYYLRQMELAKP